MVLGAANGALDVAMNAHASEVEKRWGAAIMSSFHAAWSVGSMAGSALAGVLIGVSWPLAGILGLAAVLVATLSVAGLRLRNRPGHHARRAGFALPRRTMLGICAITCLCFFAEGALTDWSAVYLRTVLAVAPALAPAGFAAFEFAMAGGRFAGDAVVRRLGPAMTLRLGGLLGATGMATVLLAAAHELAIAGFVLIGLGVSNVVPVAFSAAGRERGPGGVAMAASIGYAGLMAGPPLIGPIADLVGLRIALGTVLAAVLAVAALSRTVTPKQRARAQSLV
jgi:MFS family permease